MSPDTMSRESTGAPRRILQTIFVLTLFTAVFFPAGAPGQEVQNLLPRVEAAPPGERAAVVDSFLASIAGFPLCERDTLATFLYRGTATTVHVPGDQNNWNGSDFPMTRVSTTDLFYHTATFPREARLDYKFVLNGSIWILDPRNPYQVSGGFGPNSELRMPGYIPPAEIVYDPSFQHGSFVDTTFFSTNLGNSRAVRVYLPPGYDGSTDSLGMILFHDGLEYVTLAFAQNTIDYLIARKRIRPIIAVFVPPVNRTQEYYSTQRAAYTAFVVEELVPWVDGRFRTLRSSDSRATLGASYGGHIALWLGYSNPGVFGNVAAQSGVIPQEALAGIQTGPRLPVRFYLDMGTYEAVLLGGCRQIVQALQERGYEIIYREYPEGHSWGSWRAHIDNALEMFFPIALGVGHGSAVPSGPRLDQSYPNPFNASSNIGYQIPAVSDVRLTVSDLLGREVAVLVDERQPSGKYTVRFEGNGLASGVYFCTLAAGGQTDTRSLVLLR